MDDHSFLDFFRCWVAHEEVTRADVVLYFLLGLVLGALITLSVTS